MKRTVSRFAVALTTAVAMIAGLPANAEVINLGTVDGWSISANTENGANIRCIASKRSGQSRMRIVTDGTDWYTGVDNTGGKVGRGGLKVDQERLRVDYEFDGEYSYVRLNPNWQSRVAAGNVATFQLGVGYPNVKASLIGTRVAMNRLRQCAAQIPYEQRGRGFSQLSDNGGPNAVPPMPLQPMLPAPVQPFPVQPIPAPVPMPGQQPTPAPVQPAPATVVPCPVPGTVSSAPTDEKVTVAFDVQAVTPLTLFWVDTTGNVIELSDLTPGVQTRQGSVGDVYLVKDADGMCHGGALFVSPQMTTFQVF